MKADRITLTAMAAVAAIWGGVQTASAETIWYLGPTDPSNPEYNAIYDGESTTINGGIFGRDDAQPTGTGVFQPFVRIKMKGHERGYNTEGTAQYDTHDAGGHNWDHSITVGELAEFLVDGTAYYQFRLDINENSSGGDGHFLSMLDLELWVHDVADDSQYEDGLGTKVYDFDGAGNATLHLDHDLAEGSGKNDLIVLIEASRFGTDKGKFVYLYSEFGDPDKSSDLYASDAGFEEWAGSLGPNTPPPAVPLPGVALAGLSLMGLVGARRGIRGRRGRDADKA